MGQGMTQPTPSKSQAGGFLLAMSIIAGAIGGLVAGQPSIGLLAGIATGVALAVLIWLKDRRG